MSKITLWSIILGLAIGTGHLTKLRVLNLIGPSEVLFGIFAIYILVKHGKRIFSFEFNSLEGLIKILLFLNIFIFAPIMTMINILILKLPQSTPEYMFSFFIGWILLFGVYVLYKENNINMETVALTSSIIFITTNLISLFFFPNLSMYSETRFEGFAKNPNQIVFYSTTILILIFIYIKGFTKYTLAGLIIYIGILAGSDAYNLTLFVFVFMFFILNFTRFFKVNYKIKLLGLILIVLIISACILIVYHNEVLSLWYFADEGAEETGGGRLVLYLNSMKALILSPIIGFGLGQLSGFSRPFEGMEVHNTFLDFSLQFGLIFSFLVYSIILYSSYKAFKEKNYLFSSFIISYVILGLFHYYGRHFIFWIELSIFYSYIFNKNKSIRM